MLLLLAVGSEEDGLQWYCKFFGHFCDNRSTGSKVEQEVTGTSTGTHKKA
jgi:hypothetical protein